MAQPGQFQVGQLYNGGYVNGLKVWSQPVPGGLVYPQPQRQYPQQYQGYYQAPMAYSYLYAFACGHLLNCPEIYEVYDPYAGVQVALVCCNQCSFIQQIISPYEDYQSYIDTPIVVA
jgi:hypothetical protein